MGILVGFHVEGWDHLILRSFIAVLLGIPEEQIVPDWIDVPGRGWEFVLQSLDGAIQRFYAQCAQCAVIGIDNDGDIDLTHTGAQEDRRRPRHWNHASPHRECRFCQLEERIARARAALAALPQKPPETWPVLLAVPVETVEAWLLELLGVVNPKRGLARAEHRGRSRFKVELYGKPAAPKQDVERVALPLIRSASPAQIQELRKRSRSFDMFAIQVEQNRARILGPRDCWGPGDRGAEHVGAD
jgi:hypothetical protein